MSSTTHLATRRKAEDLSDTIEAYLVPLSRRSQSIYLGVLALLLGGLAALPLVRVPVAVSSPGIVRPALETLQLRAQVAGFVESVRVEAHDSVRTGEVLLTLRANVVRERTGVLTAAHARAADAEHDLARLVGPYAATRRVTSALRTEQYRREHAQLQHEMREYEARIAHAVGALQRARALHLRDLAPAADVEALEHDLRRMHAARAALLARTQGGWEAVLTRTRAELRELRAQRDQVAEEHARHVVRAPVDGTVEQLAGVAPGSYVQAGEALAVLSPAATVFAEVHVLPRDVGLLRTGGPVRLQVHAFHHHEWGVLTGRVQQIAQDVTPLGEQPVFRVRVALDRTHLALRNGVRGELRKGMTLTARFEVAERTLLQLLRDDAADWLSPAAAAIRAS